jgi:hypothetical protein
VGAWVWGAWARAPTPKPPIPNPQSPIPNPQFNKFLLNHNLYFQNKIKKYKKIKINQAL